jgi:hypothetical protein
MGFDKSFFAGTAHTAAGTFGRSFRAEDDDDDDDDDDYEPDTEDEEGSDDDEEEDGEGGEEDEDGDGEEEDDEAVHGARPKKKSKKVPAKKVPEPKKHSKKSAKKSKSKNAKKSKAAKKHPKVPDDTGASAASFERRLARLERRAQRAAFTPEQKAMASSWATTTGVPVEQWERKIARTMQRQNAGEAVSSFDGASHVPQNAAQRAMVEMFARSAGVTVGEWIAAAKKADRKRGAR